MKKHPTLAEYLKEARVRAGFSQREVASQLGYQSAQFVSNWERGLSMPPGKTLRKLSDLYKISADEVYEVLLQHVLQKTEQDVEREFFGRKGRER